MMTDVRHSPTTGFLAGLALWGVWAVSASPLFALFFEFQCEQFEFRCEQLEFRCEQLEECGKEWWYYARFYSHLFLYPVTFGLVSTALLHRPWIRTVHHLHSLPEGTRTGKVGLIAISMLVVVGFASYVEFTGATPAPWSIEPEVMKSSDEGMKVRELLGMKVCELLGQRCEKAFDSRKSSEKCEFIELPVPGFLSNMLSDLCKSPSSLLSKKEKHEFRENLEALWKDGDGPWSYTEGFYRAGFVAMTTLFAFLFATVFITTTRHSKKTVFITTTRHSKNGKDPEDPEAKSLLALALLFATFWVLMRITFLTEKLSIYPEDPLLIFNWLIFLVFAALYVHLVTGLWLKSERYKRHLDLALSLASIVIGVMGLLGNFLSVEWIPEVLVDVFGTGSSPETYIAVLLFLFVVHFPHILRIVEKWGSDRDG